jgi:hypothetical protein
MTIADTLFDAIHEMTVCYHDEIDEMELAGLGDELHAVIDAMDLLRFKLDRWCDTGDTTATTNQGVPRDA